MDTKIALFAILALASVFALSTPLDVAVAQSSTTPDNAESGDEGHEGKSCPSKNKKTASQTSFDL